MASGPVDSSTVRLGRGGRGSGCGWGGVGVAVGGAKMANPSLTLPVRFSKLDKHYLSVQAWQTNLHQLRLGLHGTYFNKTLPDAIHTGTFNSVLFNS